LESIGPDVFFAGKSTPVSYHKWFSANGIFVKSAKGIMC
jgi:hypothetical protein